MRPKRASAPSTTFANLWDKLSADAHHLLSDDPNTADDLAQDAVLYVLEHSQQFDDKTASYVRQRCYWESLDARGKARKYSQSVFPLSDCAHDLVSDEPGPEDVLIAREAEAEQQALVVNLLECVQQLPERQHEIISLMAQGQRQHQIAERLRISRPAVQQCLSRARSALRAQLNLTGVAPVQQ